MALANISALLSVWGYRVLCIDWDLEAPGLPLYFRDWSRNPNTPGLVDYFTTVAGQRNVDWRDFVYEVSLPGAARRTTIIPAGLQENYPASTNFLQILHRCCQIESEYRTVPERMRFAESTKGAAS